MMDKGGKVSPLSDLEDKGCPVRSFLFFTIAEIQEGAAGALPEEHLFQPLSLPISPRA
jgi:hypothetical protein